MTVAWTGPLRLYSMKKNIRNIPNENKMIRASLRSLESPFAAKKRVLKQSLHSLGGERRMPRLLRGPCTARGTPFSFRSKHVAPWRLDLPFF